MSSALLLATLVQTIWIVDAANGPGTNFTDLPAAVAAAISGDTILVRPGTYTHFNVSGKALTIRGAGAALTTVQLNGQFPFPTIYGSLITGIPWGTTFYVSGIRFNANPATQNNGYAGLRVGGAGTKAVLADLMAVGCPCANGAVGTYGLWVDSGASVHASRCSFTGGICASTGIGGDGAFVGPGSLLAADACTFTGGGPGTSGSPGDGLHTLAGVVTLSHCSAIGGNGTVGAGLLVSGFGMSFGGFARVAGDSASIISGGTGNPSGYSVAVDGPFSIYGSTAVIHGPVQLQGQTAGPVTLGAPALPYLSVTGTSTPAGELQAAQPVTITIESALPLAPFVCLVSLAPGFSTAFSSVAVGELLVLVQTPLLLEGTLDALGMASFAAIPAASVPTLLDLPLFAQVGVVDAAANNVRLSNCWIRIFKP